MAININSCHSQVPTLLRWRLISSLHSDGKITLAKSVTHDERETGIDYEPGD